MAALTRLRRFATTLALGAGLLLAGAAPAVSQPAPVAVSSVDADVLTGALARIRNSGVVRIGFREHALPFSFAGVGGTPYGYSIDLCLAIVEQIADAIGGHSPRIEYRPVTPGDRIDRVVRGEIDLECGATSNTAQRRAQVAFSPTTFVTGTKLAVGRASGLRSRRDLEGRTIAVARGTTNEEAIRHIIERERRRVAVVTTDDLEQAFDLLIGGKADAVASDDVLLLGYLEAAGLRGEYAVVGEFVSFDSYGIMFARDDPAMAAAVAAAFQRLAVTRELRWIYYRWFVRPLPTGVRLGLPMSPHLQRSFELIGLPPE